MIENYFLLLLSILKFKKTKLYKLKSSLIKLLELFDPDE